MFNELRLKRNVKLKNLKSRLRHTKLNCVKSGYWQNAVAKVGLKRIKPIPARLKMISVRRSTNVNQDQLNSILNKHRNLRLNLKSPNAALSNTRFVSWWHHGCKPR